MAAIFETTFSNEIFLNENMIKISLKFVTKGPINHNPAMVQIMAWRQSGNKPLSEPMMILLLMHICVTRPQWVKSLRVKSRGRWVKFIKLSLFSNEILLNENVIKISLKFVIKGPINHYPAMVQIIAWRWSGNKPLSEPMMILLLMLICVTWPQWVKSLRVKLTVKINECLLGHWTWCQLSTSLRYLPCLCIRDTEVFLWATITMVWIWKPILYCPIFTALDDAWQIKSLISLGNNQ